MEKLIKVDSEMLERSVWEEFRQCDRVKYNETGYYECSQGEFDWWKNQSNYAEKIEAFKNDGFDFEEFYSHYPMTEFVLDWEKLASYIENYIPKIIKTASNEARM